MNQRQPVALYEHHHHQALPTLTYHHHLVQNQSQHHPLLVPFHPSTTSYHEPGLAAPLVYPGSLHLPFQQPLLPSAPPGHPRPSSAAQRIITQLGSLEPDVRLQQTPLNLAAVSPGPYQHPSFRPSTISHQTRARFRQTQEQVRTRSQARQHQRRLHEQEQQSHLAAMAAFSLDQQRMSEDELTEFQKASNAFEAEANGPLVGMRQPSTAITTEYASADPIYQAKTAALPQKYSHYRTIRGDGKCGWRAVAYGYFEALIRQGENLTFRMEEARLSSLNNIMSQSGFDMDLFEDFAAETFGLLRRLSDALLVGNADHILHETFNDEMQQNYIITHLRTLTASWMKTHEENYAAWLLGQTVDQYCDNNVVPFAAEIDHVGLMALKDVLLSPANMSLEVLYLDRSEGSEVNLHRFDPVNGANGRVQSVRLLYRPGHYDLLYKDEVPPPVPASIPTFLQYDTRCHEPVYDIGVEDALTTIPGMSYAEQDGWLSSVYGTGDDFFSTPAAGQTCASLPTPAAPAPQPQMQIQDLPIYPTTSARTEMIPPPLQMPRELTIRDRAAQPTRPPVDSLHQPGGGPFRPSAWQYETDFVSASSQLPFQTSIFRNSHYNTAHFLNPDFQPEQWDPLDEYAIPTTTISTTKTSTRHKING